MRARDRMSGGVGVGTHSDVSNPQASLSICTQGSTTKRAPEKVRKDGIRELILTAKGAFLGRIRDEPRAEVGSTVYSAKRLGK